MKRIFSILIVALVALSLSVPAMAKGPKGGGPKGNNGNHYGWYKNGGPKGYPIYNQSYRSLSYPSYYGGYAPYGYESGGYFAPSYGPYPYGTGYYFGSGY